MNGLIFELLNNNERLIVPGFGAFMKKKDTGTIYFNEYLKFNDDLLVNFIAEKENIDKANAGKKVIEFIEQINKTLDDGKPFVFEGVGGILKDEKGKLKFSQDDKGSISSKTDKKEEKQEPVSTSQPPVKKGKMEPEKAVADDKPKEIEKEKVSKKEKDEKQEVVPLPIAKEEKKELKKAVADDKPKEIEKEKDKKQEVIPPPVVEEKKETPPPPPSDEKKDEKSENVPEEKKKSDSKIKEPVKGKKAKQKKEKPKKKEKKIKEKGEKKKSKWWLWLIIIIVVIVGGAYGFAFLKPEIACKYVKLPFIDCSKQVKVDIEHREHKIVADSENEVKENVEIENVTDTSLASTNDTVNVDEVVETDEVVEETIEGIEEVEEIEEVVEETEPVEETTPVETYTASGKKYYVVAGCFSSENNADKLVNKLRGEGYDAKKFGKIGSLHAVCFSCFDKKQDALNEIAKIGSSEAWLKYK